MKILIAGDFAVTDRVERVINSGNYYQLFGECITFVKEANVSIMNFETPIVNRDDVPISKCGPCLRAPYNAIQAIKEAGFSVVTLANNHIKDYGQSACINTINELVHNGISTVGAGKSRDEAAKILYIEKDNVKVAVINCCEHEFSLASETEAGANPLNPIQQYYSINEAKKQADYIIVIVHGGHEHYQLPSLRMQETYRSFIDSGADVVVNHHQHCYSGMECYRNGFIFYGLGNFCFDNANKRNDIWNEGFMLELSLCNGEVKWKAIPYVQCDKNVGVTLMKNREKFDQSFNALSQIIANHERLRKEQENYYSHSASLIRLLLEPFKNRTYRKLLSLGILKSSISKNRANLLYNFIACESHKDKVLFTLNNIK